MQRQQDDWVSLGTESWLIGWEAARVIWLRNCLIALGGTAGELEARRMMEKQFAAATTHHGRGARANSRRLSRP